MTLPVILQPQQHAHGARPTLHNMEAGIYLVPALAITPSAVLSSAGDAST